MQTIKTAVVVVLLLGVCYGAYVALNAPEPILPPELGLEDWPTDQAPEVSLGAPASVAVDIPQLNSSVGSMPDTLTPPSLPTLTLPPAGDALVADSATEGPSVALPLNGAELPKLDMPKTEMPKSSAPPAELAIPTPSASQTSDTPSDIAAADSVTLPSFSGGGPELLGTTTIPKSAIDSSAKSKTGEVLPPAQPKMTFELARQSALKMAGEGKLREALSEMSLFYNSPEVTHEQHTDLVDLLDALAAEVIYSKRHLVEPPYHVAPGDTLEAIAAKHKVSPETLARINGLGDSKIVLAGAQLKVITGPFRGDVNLNRGELTLFLGDLYAGRFPISVGADPSPRDGNFEIVEKRRDRTYYGAGGNVLKSDDPRNPYGGVWLSLGQDLCIHGTPEMGSPEVSRAGCISLAPIDAKDVYTILAQGCRVSIHR